MGYIFKISREGLKNFPFLYEIPTRDTYLEDDYALFDDEGFDYLTLNSKGDLSGVKGDTSYDIVVNEDEDEMFSKEDIEELKKRFSYTEYEEMD